MDLYEYMRQMRAKNHYDSHIIIRPVNCICGYCRWGKCKDYYEGRLGCTKVHYIVDGKELNPDFIEEEDDDDEV